jgi:hypothetical protein
MYKKFSWVIALDLTVSFGLLISLGFPGWACVIMAISTKPIVMYRLSMAAIIVC